MRIFKFYLAGLIFLVWNCAFAQVQVDHPIQLTGAGSNASIFGIQQIPDTSAAANAKSIQNGSLVFGTTTGSSNNLLLSISPPPNGYARGMAFNFISNQTVTGAATLTINSLGAVPIKKNINQDLGSCDIQSQQVVTVVYDGTNFQMISVPVQSYPTVANAGPNQLNLTGSTATLAGNTPVSGTGAWAIVSGAGGSVVTSSSPTSVFNGVSGSVYVLSWTISTACASSVSYDTISFNGTSSFTTPGGPYTFTVPASITSVTLQCWGAQGQTLSVGAGGLGGYAEGVLSVSPGSQLYVFVGGENGTNGGGAGSNNGGSGGGMSDVRQGGTTFGYAVIVAGGGGGGGTDSASTGGPGGGGSSCANGAGGGGGHTHFGTNGGNGTCTSGGTASNTGSNGGGFSGGGGGGGLTGGGAGSSINSGQYAAGAGTQGQGGARGVDASCGCSQGAGGGGGYWGGGGTSDGCCGSGAGGGGSSWAGSSLTSLVFTGGIQSGNGQVVISW